MRALWLFVYPALGFGFTIQNISGPHCEDGPAEIRRYVIFEQDKKANFGFCTEVEPRCLPNSPSFVVKRKTDIVDYQKRLAAYFKLEPKYLLYDDKTELNFESTKTLLGSLAQSPEVDESEKAKAREKLSVMNAKGGIVDKFKQARAIKRGLKWDPAKPDENFVVYEKSQKQFAQAADPFDYVLDSETKDALTILEPSTELTWAFAGEATWTGAVKSCGKREHRYRLPTLAEWKIASRWIGNTPIGEKLKGSASKEIWLSSRRGNESNNNDSMVSTNYSKQTLQFPYLSTEESEPSIEHHEVFSGSRTNLPVLEIKELGDKTPTLNVLCVTDEPSF